MRTTARRTTARRMRETLSSVRPFLRRRRLLLSSSLNIFSFLPSSRGRDDEICSRKESIKLITYTHASDVDARASLGTNERTNACVMSARERPRRAIALVLALVSIVVFSALSVLAVVPTVDGLPRLNDETFERETQSSTGQTTGTWVVLFERGPSARSARARRALTEARDELLESGAVAASVDAEESPETFDRFRLVVKTTPSVMVLRSGRAYVREVTSEDDGTSLERFARLTYAEEGAEHDIPPPLTFIQKKFARVTTGIAVSIVRLYARTDALGHTLTKDYRAVSRAWSRGGYKAARDVLSKAMETSSSEYGLLFMLIGGVFVVTAGILAVVTFPTDSLNQAKKTKTE